MKKLLLLCVFISPLAMADEAAKPEETVTLSQEATAPLFERVRGALNRAVKDGKVVATTTGSTNDSPAATSAPARKTN